MTEDLPDVPDWIEEKIEFDSQREVQDHHIVDIFQKADRPFLSRNRVETELGMSDEGARQRLLDLEELEVIDSCSAAGGRIYWIYDKRSEWPIPPDIQIEPVSDELTVSELTDRDEVQYGVIAILAAMVGSVSITGIVVATALGIGTDGIAFAAMAILGGFGALGGAVFGVLAVAVWIAGKLKNSDPDRDSVS